LISIPPILLIAGILIDSSVALYHYSALNHTTAALSRHLAAELGTAINTGAISSLWGGSCNAFLRATGDTYLNSINGGSMTDSNATYYFGKSLDEARAVDSDPLSPYPILCIEGETAPPALMGRLNFGVGRVQYFQILEFNEDGCPDV
jgi:hypothetical protein